MTLRVYIVSYDIMDEKRLTNIRKTLKGYGFRLHYSVYRCDISENDLIVLIGKIEDIINNHEDRIMVIDLGPVRGSAEKHITYLGKQTELHDDLSIIV